jgi:hypothetical protein
VKEAEAIDVYLSVARRERVEILNTKQRLFASNPRAYLRRCQDLQVILFRCSLNTLSDPLENLCFHEDLI